MECIFQLIYWPKLKGEELKKSSGRQRVSIITHFLFWFGYGFA